MRTHIPVLSASVVAMLLPDGRRRQRLIDGTVGGGGHSRALLAAGVQEVLAFDLDLEAIAMARDALAAYRDRATLCHASYLHMREKALARGWDAVDAIILDLGLSSIQLDSPTRGFAFRRDARLDMRFDAGGKNPTAHELVNSLSEQDLADLFFHYGEAKRARRIARLVIQHRPIHTTRQLADIVAQARPRHQSRKAHPATQVFQALRIAVNQELDNVEKVLPIAVDLLRPGGRLAVIAFHSLEDRIVKQTFKEMAAASASPPGMASIPAKAARVKLVNRKPIIADGEEISGNPRSRSAKLRVVEKLETQ